MIRHMQSETAGQLLRGCLPLVLFATLLFPPIAAARVFVVGSIHSDPVHEIDKFWPIASYLGRQLRPDGIKRVKVVVAKSLPQMATFLREGRVDLYIDSPFAAAVVNHLSGSKFLLRRWKRGIGEYRTVIFTRKDSGIHRLEDLKGTIIGFDDPASSSGYLLPKLLLTQQGHTVVQKRKASSRVRPDEVGYVFSGADENTMVWVLRGKVVAGATDNQSYRRMARHQLSRLRIVYESFAMPRQIVSYRADLSPTLVQRITDILQTMSHSQAGRHALREFGRTAKFDPIPAQALAPFMQARDFIEAEFGGAR